jgi:hypothetical protein
MSMLNSTGQRIQINCPDNASRCRAVLSEGCGRLSIRAHSFRKKIYRINACNHLAQLSALATSRPFALVLTPQYESGAHVRDVAPSDPSAAPDYTS